MLVSTKMRTGFNTDVQHEGHVYHVQSEDGGKDNPIFESLVYVGGTVVAKKLTPYPDQFVNGATEESIASLLKRQHQVIIAAIKAGRIEDLIRHSRKEQGESEPRKKSAALPVDWRPDHSAIPPKHAAKSDIPAPGLTSTAKQPQPSPRNSGMLKSSPSPSSARGTTGSLNFDQVIADHLKRSSDQATLDVSVLTPEGFTAGKNVGLRVQVMHDAKPEYEAVVTVKIIGTAFKPQVLIGRVGRDGVASFSLTLPAFTAGTAAIVIEAQSRTGRGELKNLIRRA